MEPIWSPSPERCERAKLTRFMRFVRERYHAPVPDYVLFVRLRDGLTLDDNLRDEIRNTIRANTTPRHVPARIVQAPDLPRTINGKLVELAVRDTVHGRAVKNLDALANAQALDFFKNLPELAE